MMFSELYGIYYKTVANILGEAVLREKADAPALHRKEIQEIICQNESGEGRLLMEEALFHQKWQLLHEDGTTALSNVPSMPLTMLEKQWMKAISLDPRIRLFDEEIPEFIDDDSITPLFRPEDIVFFDRYEDGDPFEDPTYITHFRLILGAIKKKEHLLIEMEGRNGRKHNLITMPERLEYSEKDDKFRLIGSSHRHKDTINLARIQSCKVCDNPEAILKQAQYHPRWRKLGQTLLPQKQTVVLLLTDERNALERVMLHFAHFEKEAEKLDEKHYRITITYDQADDTEMLIRILSFGPLVRVVGPRRFVRFVEERLHRQTALWEK